MPAHDRTPETQLLSNVWSIIAEYERAKLLERTMRGLRGRAKEGRRAAHVDTEQGTITSKRDCFIRQPEQCDKELKKEAAYITDVITLEDFKAKKAEIGVRRARTERELKRLAEQQRVLEQAARETASLVEYCAREEKRVALSALNITVYWHPPDTPPEIHGSIPLDFAYSTPGCAASPAQH